MERDYEESGVSTFHHDHYQMAHVFESIIVPHITNRATRVYYENLDWGTAELEELVRAFSLLVKLPKTGKNKVSHRRMRDSDLETLPWQLSARDTIYYNREQKDKDKALVQMHTDFALELQVLFHTAPDCFRTPTDGSTTEQLLESASSPPRTMLFEYFGKHIV